MTFYNTIFFFKQLWIIATFTSLFLLLLNHHATSPSSVFHRLSSINPPTTTATTAKHIVFAIASSAKTFEKRKDYVRVWYTPNTTRAYLFLDRQLSNDTQTDLTLPPVLVHENTDGFPYNNSKGDRSAVAMSRMVKSVTSALRNESEVRWYVFGDDDTVFVVDNVVSALSAYDHDEWYYVGGISESYEQNAYFSFEMGYGGGGFALSRGLAEVLAGVVDSCIGRYPQLYGSDARVFSCLAELGVGLTHEPGFHQVDLWGNLFGLLSSHPQSLLLSLHHLDGVQPLFPNVSRLQALQRLFTAVRADPARISQQTVCYDPNRSLSVSLAWGYSVQIYEENRPLPDLLQPLQTFHPWNREKRTPRFMFKTRRVPSNPCRRPLVLFLDRVEPDSGSGGGVRTRYTRQRHLKHCFRNPDLANLQTVNVFSNKLDVRGKAPRRRQCCDISSSWDESMDIRIRVCGRDELTTMFT